MRRKKILIQPTLRDRKGDLSKRWYVEVSQRNPETGEFVRKRFEIFEDVNINSLKKNKERHELAKKLIADLTEKIKSGWTIFNDTETVVYEDQTQYSAEAVVFKKMISSNKNYTYWCSKYMIEVLKDMSLRKGTTDTYESRYRVFKNWLMGKKLIDLDIKMVTNEVIIEFFIYLRDIRKYTKHTAGSYAGLLSNLFDFIVKNKGVMTNPVHSLPINKIEKGDGAECFYKEDLYTVMKVMDEVDPQLALACRFEYYCGLRPGFEIRYMRVRDLNLHKGVSKVVICAENSKSTRRKEVIIPDVFLDYLLDFWHLDKFNKDLYVFGREKVPGDQRLGKNTLRDRFNRIREELNLPNIYKFYSFKHTGAVTLAEEGEPIINIRDHLGHESVSTTEHYLKRHGFNNSPIIRHKFPRI
jgi:integrase